jgi:hypothetical protein
VSRILDEFWHATARAPRRFPGESLYGIGRDVLGAVAISRTALKPSAMTTAAPAPTAVMKPTAVTVQPVATTTTTKMAPTAVTVQPVVTAAPQMGPTATAVRPTMVTPQTKVSPTAVRPTMKPTMKPGGGGPSLRAKDAAKAKARVAVNKANAAANRAIAVGRKLAARKHGRAGTKLQTVGKKLIQRAATHIKGEFLGATTAQLGERQLVEAQLGDMTDEQFLQATMNALSTWMWRIEAMNSLATAGEILDVVAGLVEQLRAVGQAELANAGDAIAARAQAVIDSFNEEAVADDVTPTVNVLRSDATAWQSQAQAALSGGPATTPPTPPVDPSTGLPVGEPAPSGGTGPLPFDPGTAGGGGGGGGADPFEDSGDSGSEATARFRESGGAWDPFEEGEGGDYEPGALDEARAALEEESYHDRPVAEEGSFEEREDAETSEEPYPYMEYDEEELPEESFISDESEVVSQFRESGGAADPLEDQFSGLDFEWTDLFMPHRAIQRWYDEQQKVAVLPPKEGGVARGQASDAAQERRAAAQAQLIAARLERARRAKERLAEIEARLAAVTSGEIE